MALKQEKFKKRAITQAKTPNSMALKQEKFKKRAITQAKIPNSMALKQKNSKKGHHSSKNPQFNGPKTRKIEKRAIIQA